MSREYVLDGVPRYMAGEIWCQPAVYRGTMILSSTMSIWTISLYPSDGVFLPDQLHFRCLDHTEPDPLEVVRCACCQNFEWNHREENKGQAQDRKILQMTLRTTLHGVEHLSMCCRL